MLCLMLVLAGDNNTDDDDGHVDEESVSANKMLIYYMNVMARHCVQKRCDLWHNH